MLERLVAPWPCERFAPSLTVSVPPPLGAPPPSAQAKGRAFDRIDAWLDGIFDAQNVEALIGTERN